MAHEQTWSEEVVRAPGTVVNDVCEPPCVCWKPNLGPLEEQQMPLTESKLQPHVLVSSCCCEGNLQKEGSILGLWFHRVREWQAWHEAERMDGSQSLPPVTASSNRTHFLSLPNSTTNWRPSVLMPKSMGTSLSNPTLAFCGFYSKENKLFW